MTAQAREQIIYLGKQYCMKSLPIESFFNTLPSKVKFISFATDCWRGYNGKWEVKENKLYLIQFNGYSKDEKEMNLNTLFPEQNEAFAFWYTGVIEIESGKLINYEHFAFDSVYEHSIMLEFKDGILINKSTINNRKTIKSKISIKDLIKKAKEWLKED
jgi:hypothetical protein